MLINSLLLDYLFSAIEYLLSLYQETKKESNLTQTKKEAAT